MVQLNKTERPMVPVLPNWCDYHSYGVKERITFLGVIRCIVNLILFILFVTFLSIKDYTVGVRVLLIEVSILTLVHIVASLYFIYAAQAGHPYIVKRWLICDFTITSIFIISVIALLCITPDLNRVVLIVGIKLIITSMWFCYRLGMGYIRLKDPPFQLHN